MFEIKNLGYKQLPGLSERQLAEHHDVLYAGYVKKANELAQKQFEANLEGTNATYSDLREIKMEQTFALNGMILHELYFENMGNSEISEDLKKEISASFDSFQVWEYQFMAMGLASRGWVVLAKMPDGSLENILCDAHNQGGIWGAKPLLVLDVYEHAYFLDYGTNRKGYIEFFMKNINWDVVQKRMENKNG
jgi:superoxide dismutase, Fe-Mn family